MLDPITLAVLAIIYGIGKAGGIKKAFGSDNPSHEDMKRSLNEKLEKGEITREQYDKAIKLL